MEKSTTYGNQSGGLFQLICHIPTAMGAFRFHSSSIPADSCPFLWIPADSSGMGSFLQESVGHGEVLPGVGIGIPNIALRLVSEVEGVICCPEGDELCSSVGLITNDSRRK